MAPWGCRCQGQVRVTTVQSQWKALSPSSWELHTVVDACSFSLHTAVVTTWYTHTKLSFSQPSLRTHNQEFDLTKPVEVICVDLNFSKLDTEELRQWNVPYS